MAIDKKISELANGAPAQAGDEYVVARSGSNYKLTLTNIAATMPPIGASTPNSGAFTTLSASSGATLSGGNLAFTTTAQRITGDFSNATTANRLAFQTSTTNGATVVGAIPNGTSNESRFVVYSTSDPNNSSIGQIMFSGTSDFSIRSGLQGTGSNLPMTFYTGGSERVRIDTSGGVNIGSTANYGGLLSVNRFQSAGIADLLTLRDATAGATFNLQTYSDPTYGTANRFDFNGAYLAFRTGTTERMRIDSSGNVGIGTASPSSKLEVSGIIKDSAGNVRAVPPVGTKTGSYSLGTGDVGKYVQVGTGGSITIPDATFAEGDVVSIFNNTTGNITITCTITTAYIAGTDSDKASVTLATRGVATILFISGTVCVISGNVS